MIKSEIRVQAGNPTLWLDGRQACPMAYTTYFDERNDYLSFIRAGYRIFFVNLAFTLSPINSLTGFTPFRVGIFEDPSHPDYSEFETAVHRILALCPDAVIFPRIYVSMPKWWVEENPGECIPTLRGGNRELLFSEKFRADAEALLRRVIQRIKGSDYASRIGGWQLCGGMTQEWFQHGLTDGLTEGAAEPFRRWVAEVYGENDASLPSAEEFEYGGNAEQLSENARRYALFCNLGVARSLNHFARTIKEETNGEQVVGAFYGYSFECWQTVLYGSHGLRSLLDSPNLDFFSSPNAYTDKRAFGIDWSDMLPIASLKHHGKLCFIECDIRTYLTTSIQEARPNRYPDDIYKVTGGRSVWSGPPTPELSREALRKCFAHQITKASAIWWFDMWGGWYRDPVLMEALFQMKEIYDKDPFDTKSPLSPQVLFFADECAYANLFSHSPQLKAISESRKAMGNVGAPYDMGMVEDAATLLPGYQVAIFPSPIPSEAGKRAIALCEKQHIPYLCAEVDRALSTEQIRSFLSQNGVHLYTEENDVVYVGNGYLGLHSATGGVKTLSLPSPVRVTPIFGAENPVQSDVELSFLLKENGTALFSMK